ncbi:amidohydrolase [Sinorhizobium mexicanum]|uniref:Amidohydrolase n=1 Tax=Sinorhizobium mexicanum TaxID=375549 RepID=A0A859QU11_9HYPH|nr:amidohydrolase [Sinorhizobium mexicanum]MBP1882398.1 amidohydrolase [Sinorhizobium mexicanum]QLL62101.1 amidohydrolase [Sinorhizobium mexicanum]
MFLSGGELDEVTAFRRALHRRPELSGAEAETARAVERALEQTRADEIVTGLGGHGVAAIYRGKDEGPTVMIRAELDGLPITEVSDLPHRSEIAGKGHLCGHDGHMAILMALAKGLGRERPARGRAILLFQPAEENGAGAAAVLADPKFSALKPDFVFSLHNFPGLPLGHVALAEGPVNCASRGMKITLSGKTAHASSPEDGIAPTFALARLLSGLTALGAGGALDENFTLATVTHAKLGEEAFGISPGYAEIWATLRTLTDERMAALVANAEALVRREAEAAKLDARICYEDVFHQCSNAASAVGELRRALDEEGVSHDRGAGALPMKASEDFGLFGRVAPSAMFFLGAGENHPRLHNPDYDFPDALIGIGARVFMRAIRNLAG